MLKLKIFFFSCMLGMIIKKEHTHTNTHTNTHRGNVKYTILKTEYLLDASKNILSVLKPIHLSGYFTHETSH